MSQNVDNLGLGSFNSGEDEDAFEDIFPAKITAATLVSGVWLYNWTEQSFNPSTGAYTPAVPGRSGTGSTSPVISPAQEVNNLLVNAPAYVWMRYRTMVGGQPRYEFSAGQQPFTVEDSSGSPAYTNVNTIEIGQSHGLTLANPSTGIALVDITFADAIHNGTVSTTTQTFAGDKQFGGAVTVDALLTAASNFFVTGTSILTGLATFNGGILVNTSAAFNCPVGSYGNSGPNGFVTFYDSTHPSRYIEIIDTNTNSIGGSGHAGLLSCGDDNGIVTLELNGNDCSFLFRAYNGSSVTPGLKIGITGGGVRTGQSGTSGGGDTVTSGMITTLGSGATLTVGTTPIASGTNGDLLYQAGGVLSEIGLGTGLAVSGGNLTYSPAIGSTTVSSAPSGYSLLYCDSSGNLQALTGTAGQFAVFGSLSAVSMSGDATMNSSGVVTLASSGVTASTYGDASHVGQFTVDAKGRITTASSVAIALAASAITSGQLTNARGGTGLDTSAASNGQILIGNGSGFTLHTISAGANVSITNGAGTISIAVNSAPPTVATANSFYLMKRGRYL